MTRHANIPTSLEKNAHAGRECKFQMPRIDAE